MTTRINYRKHTTRNHGFLLRPLSNQFCLANLNLFRGLGLGIRSTSGHLRYHLLRLVVYFFFEGAAPKTYMMECVCVATKTGL